MLISESRRLVVVHVQRTGGNSLERALKGVVPDLRREFHRHDHAAWCRDAMGVAWDRYHKVAFVRNPWDRLVSWYALIQGSGSSADSEYFKDRPPSRFYEYVRRTASSFAEAVERCTDVVDDPVYGRKCLAYRQLDHLCDEHDELLVDFVGRYETLAEDVQRVFDRLELGPARLPHLNRKAHEHYSRWYDPRTRDLVATRFADDCARFGYRFESEPLSIGSGSA